MPSLNWGLLNPENVAQLMTFEADNKEWKYQEDSQSMAARQAEGVAYLWNLLAEKNVAVLADEVGMGKTFQALGIATLLWRLKPHAKVLVMAPNRDICKHWKREYGTFVKQHYHYSDHRVKNAIDNGPVQSIHTCYSLDELASTIESGVGHLFLTTIHSLSHLVKQDKNIDKKELPNEAQKQANIIRERILGDLGKNNFDLIIIDEAHYFRNKGGDSQRVSAAQGFFGLTENKRLADKVLLLTATPTHSQFTDLKNILSYFIDLPTENNDPKSLMDEYGLRRLRRMQGKDKKGNEQFFSKRNYRHEKGLACGFDDPASEAFFAMYQKKLVTEPKLDMTKTGKRPLYGYLEGFESISVNEVESEDQKQTVEQGGDFNSGKDAEILGKLSRSYHKIFKKFPDHPKYGKLIKECIPENIFSSSYELSEHKHLVFVRRIPSVRELTQRINAAYDEVFAQEICQALMTKDGQGVNRFEDWKKRGLSREAFVNLFGEVLDDAGEELSETENIQEENVDENDGYLGSKISDLFVVKKSGIKRTDASNARLRFRKSESIFSLFLEPASDYKQAGYKFYYQTEKGDKVRATYLEAAKNARFGDKQNFKSEKLPDEKEAAFENQDELFTVWTLIYPELSIEQQEKIERWSDEARENFANYIKTGFLYASPVMVELYIWFVKFRSKGLAASAQKNYQEFYKFAQKRIEGSLLLAYFKSALDTFEQLCGKIIDHKLDDWKKDWNILTGLQQPAWYASGDTSNKQRLILGFNSPFYPNVLIATSVFQEGVNLHLQCSKVHHYGLAGSPGANEQRVGRVDRLFGRINHQLMQGDSDVRLAIKYPYLEKTVDEDQVISFLKRKYKDEDSLDNCSLASSDGTAEYTDEKLEKYLRHPSEDDVTDPYKADFDDEKITNNSYAALDLTDAEKLDITDYITSLLNELINPEKDKLYKISCTQNFNEILLIDCFVDDNIERKQPIVVELNFSADFSSLVKETVYTLTLKTPIASKNNLTSGFENSLVDYTKALDDDYPLVSIALNPNATKSNFYLYMHVDLPIFAGIGQMAFLSKSEVQAAFEQLRQAADYLEHELFNGEQDLRKKQLGLQYESLSEKDQTAQPLVAERKNPVSNATEGWIIINSKAGSIERIGQSINNSSKLKTHMHASTKEGMQAIFELNHSLSFIKCLPQVESGNLELVMSYPAGDIQEEERQLLRAWFDYVRSK